MVFFVLGSRILTVTSIANGVMRTFKLLKHKAKASHLVAFREADGVDVGYKSRKEYEAIIAAENEEGSLLMFFVVFALMMLSNEYVEFLVDWFPFYYLMKCALLVWIQLPGAGGARYLFEKVVGPIMERQSKRFGPWVRIYSSHLLRAIHATLLDFCIQGADNVEIEKLHKNLQSQLKRIRLEKEERSKKSASGENEGNSNVNIRD